MPGKVNPVMCESLMMIGAQVIGHSQAVMVSNTHGNLDLNVMMPVMARALLESISIMGRGVSEFTGRAARDMEANKEKAEGYVAWSLSMVTSLAPVIGYDKASKIAKRSIDENKTVRQLCEALPQEARDEVKPL